MIVVDILCIYSCIDMILSYRAHKKVYFILKGEGLLDKLAIYALSRFGWEFIQLSYNLGSVNSRSSYVDTQTDLFVLMEQDVAPAIEKAIRKWKCFSEYEKRHLSSYMAFLERHNLHQKIEILHVIELLKDRIGKPDVVLLYSSRWKDFVSIRYADKGYRASFYKIYFLLKLQYRKDYYHANLVEGIVNRRGFCSLMLVFSKIMLDVFNSAYSGILKYFRSEAPKKIEKFDICAIIPGYDRTEWFNDLFWKRGLKGKNYRTLAILYGSFDDSAYDTYGYLAERWVSLNKTKPSPYLYSAFYWLWPVFPYILIRNIFRFLYDALVNNIPLDYTARILSFLLEESKLEALFKITGARLCWSSIGFSHLQSLAGIIAINRLKGVSLGTIWSSYMMSMTALPLHNNDVFFIWGIRHAHIFNKAISKSKIISGYPGDNGLDHYLSKAKVLREKWEKQFGDKIILCFYDDYFARDDGYSFTETVDYVNNLLLWVIKRSETMLVIKSKRQGIFDAYPSSTTILLKTLESKQRLICEFEVSDLAPGFAADIVLGVGLTTLPCLMGTYGKKVISLDCNRYNKRWPVGAANIIFLEQSEDIVKNLDDWIGEVGVQNVNKNKIEIRPTPNELDSFVDGKSAERISAYISDLIENLNGGRDPDEAISNANRIFSGHWGSDKVIEADKFHNEF